MFAFTSSKHNNQKQCIINMFAFRLSNNTITKQCVLNIIAFIWSPNTIKAMLCEHVSIQAIKHTIQTVVYLHVCIMIIKQHNKNNAFLPRVHSDYQKHTTHIAQHATYATNIIYNICKKHCSRSTLRYMCIYKSLSVSLYICVYINIYI